MTALESFVLKIKRQENGFYRLLYRTARGLQHFNMPSFLKPLYLLLYYAHSFLLAVWESSLRIFYYEPMMRARCESVGKGFYLLGGMPYINGHVRIRIGDNVMMHGKTTITTSKMSIDPVLEIGDNSYLGYAVTIGLNTRVSIGKHCLLANDLYIADNDGHPLDPEKRRKNVPVDIGDCLPVVIEDDVWIGNGTRIMKGVTIGRGAVIGANSTVTKDVPPFSIAVGNPAKVIRKIGEADSLDKAS